MVAAIAAGAGVALAHVRSDDHADAPPVIGLSGDAEAADVVSEMPSKIGGSALDERIVFPEVLGDLPAPPGRLLADAVGRLWIPLYLDGYSDAVVYRYDLRTGELESIDLPDDSGSWLFSGLDMAPDGSIVLAYGSTVVVVDQNEASIRAQFKLPEVPRRAVVQTYDEGHWVTDASVGPDGILYVGRMNASSLTTVDLLTGTVSEIEIPASFGPVERVEAGAKGVFISDRFGGVDTDSQSALLTIDGDLVSTGRGITEYVRDGSSGAIAVSADRSLVRLIVDESGSVSKASVAESAAQYLSGVHDAIAGDDFSGLWVAGRGTEAIVHITDGGVDVFTLPIQNVTNSCPLDVTCDVEGSHIHVAGLAVLPDGSVFFSDASNLRIGLIQGD
jgi:hypothetical protein